VQKLSELVPVIHPEEPHCAIVLLLDTSESMKGAKNADLEEGIRNFKTSVCGVDGEGGDPLARKRVDLSIMIFSSSVTVMQDFAPVDDFQPTPLTASGSTAMGAAIERALDSIEERKLAYQEMGVDYHRPWVVLITDGEPNDMQQGDAKWNQIKHQLRDGEAKKKFAFFTVAVEGANMEALRDLVPASRPPVMMRPGMFSPLFEWLSRSLSSVSASRVGEPLQLENPTIGPNAWAV